MTTRLSPKAKALKQINLAKIQLEQAMRDFEQGVAVPTIILTINKAIENLRMVDKALVQKHFKECLPKMKPEQMTDELVKTFKYSQR